MINVNHSCGNDGCNNSRIIRGERGQRSYISRAIGSPRLKCDDKTWGRVESGEFKAFSIEGKSQRERVTLDDGSEASKLYDLQG